MDDLMPIGEFSLHSRLSAKRLRSYASEGLLVPAAVDPATGYRYYSPGQLHEAQVIDALRRAGMPLADIRIVLGRPCEGYLDDWARQLDADAQERRKALERARRLLVNRGAPPPAASGNEATKGSKMTLLRTAGRSETGRVREQNEDAIVGGDRLALVADGMGGPPGGDIAAHVAAALVQAAFTGRSVDELEAAVRAANWAIWDRASGRPDLSGMGTTICAAGLLDDGEVSLVSVGDSRAYLWSAGSLAQLTVDHTVTADLVSRGALAEEDAHQHPHFGILTRALGVAPDVTVDSRRLELESGDRLLVCSDGLTNELSSVDISGVMAERDDLAATADRLVEMALSRGGRDNVSVVVAEVAA